MWIRRTFIYLCGLFLACCMVLPSAYADESNQATRLTFTHAVEIPHQILPAGTYWFILEGSPGEHDVVQIFNHNRSELCATLLTAPVIRSESTNHTAVTFAERPANKPEALLKWYYPGRLTGHEFLYRTKHEREFAHDHTRTAFATSLKSRS